jgi:hypothetical protein
MNGNETAEEAPAPHNLIPTSPNNSAFEVDGEVGRVRRRRSETDATFLTPHKTYLIVASFQVVEMLVGGISYAPYLIPSSYANR